MTKVIFLALGVVLLAQIGCHQDLNARLDSTSMNRSNKATHEESMQAEISSVNPYGDTSASVNMISDPKEDLGTVYDAFMKIVSPEVHGDDPYPFDIAGIYEDNGELVVLIVEGFENRYQDQLRNDLPIRFGTATFSRRELDVALERLAGLMGDWNQSSVQETTNQIIFSYDTGELEAFLDLDTDGSLWSYLEAVGSEDIPNGLNVDLDQLKKYFTPKLMQNVMIAFGEPVTPD